MLQIDNGDYHNLTDDGDGAFEQHENQDTWMQ